MQTVANLETDLPRTERANAQYAGLDTWASADILDAILQAQVQAIKSVGPALLALAEAVDAIVTRLERGGRLIYVGAGSSGLMAQVDALELSGTYGISADQVKVVLAGGAASLVQIIGDAEDDSESAVAALEALQLASRDCVVAVTASGRTPFAVAALEYARAQAALCIGIACNAGTPVLTRADHALLIETPPEVVSGSTRMNAGTAQKCALNMLSTLLAIRLGHVHDGLMVNMAVANAKLEQRAVNIVLQVTGADDAAARAALDASGNNIKQAILIASGADTKQAAQILENRAGNVRAALAELAACQAKARDALEAGEARPKKGSPHA